MAEFEDIIVRFGLDSDQFTRGIKQLNQQMRLVESEFKAASEKIGGFGNTTDQLKLKADALTKQIDVQKQKMDLHKAAVQDSANKLEKHAQATVQVKAKLDQAKAAYEASVQSLGKNASQTQRLQNEVKQLEQQYQRSVQAVNNANQKLEANKIKANQAEAALSKLKNELQRTNEQFQKQSSVWNRMGESFQGVGQRMQQVGTEIAQPFSVAATAIGGALAFAVKKSMDFGAQMSRVGAIAGATGGDLEELRKNALELGASTSKSAMEVAQGMEMMAAKGYETNQIIAAMPGVIAAAEASGEDMALVADTVSSALNAFQLNASQSTHVADVLAMAANKSAAGILDMQYAFKYAAPVAKQLGISLEELAAATGIMSNSGIKGEQAGTSLRAALLRLADPPKAAANQLLDLGIKIEDAKGNMLPFSNIIGQVAKATEGMGTAQKSAAISTIFGTEAVSGMLALIEAGPEKINAFSKELKNSDGAAAEAAQKMKDNLAGALEELGGAFETAQISIGNALTPAIQSLAEGIKEIIDWFNQLSPATQSFLTISAAVSTAVMGLVAVFGLVAAGIGSFVIALGFLAPFAPLIAAMTAVTAAGSALYINWDKLTAKYPTLMKVLSFVNPFVSLVAGIKSIESAMSDSIPKTVDFGDKVSESTKKAVQGYLDLDKQAGSALTNMSQSVNVVTQKQATDLVSTFDKMGGQIKAAIAKHEQEAVQQAQQIFQNSKTLSTQREQEIIANTRKNYDQQAQAVQQANQRIEQIIQNAAVNHRSITQNEANEINMLRSQMKDQAINYLTQSEIEQRAILERLRQHKSQLTAQEAVEAVQQANKIRDTEVKAAEETYQKKIEAIIRMRDEAKSISADEAQKLIDDAKKVRDEQVKHAEDARKNVVEAAKQQAAEHANQIDFEKGEVLSKWDVIVKELSKKYDDIKKNASKAWEQLKTDTAAKIESIKVSAIQKYESMKASLQTKMEAIKTNIRNRWENIKSDTIALVNQIIQWPGKKWEEMKTAIQKKMGEIKEGISRKWNEVMTFFQGIDLYQVGVDIISGLIRGITGKAGELYEKAREIANKIESTIRSALDTHSPSRKMQKVGHDVGDGLKKGLKEKEKEVKKSSKTLGEKVLEGMKAAVDALETKLGGLKAQFELGIIVNTKDEKGRLEFELKNLNEQFKVQQDIVNRVRGTYEQLSKTKGVLSKETAEAANKYAQEAKALSELAGKISDVQLALLSNSNATALAKEDIELLNAEHERELANLDEEAGKLAELELKRKQTNESIQAQAVLVAELNKEYEAARKVKGADAEETRKAYMEYIRAQTEQAKLEKELRNTSKAIIEQKKELEEANKKAQKETDKTNEKLREQQEAIQDTVKKVGELASKYRDDLAKAQEEYQRKVADTNQKLLDDERKVTEQFENELASRAKSLRDFVGLFDAVQSKDVSGQQLLDNLKGQVDTFEDWQKNIQELSARGIDEGLLKELRDMGPKAASEIAALNTLSDAELSQYVSLWREKNQLAKNEATVQLEATKQEMYSKLAELRVQASQQLQQYADEWQKKNEEITKNTTEELKKMVDEAGKKGEEMIASLALAITKSLPQLASAFRGIPIFDALLGDGNAGGAAVDGAKQQADGVIGETVRQKTGVIDNTNQMTQAVNQVWALASQQMAQQQEQIRTQMLTTWQTIQQQLLALWNKMLADLKKTWTEKQKFLFEVLNQVETRFNGLVNAANNWGLNLMNNFISAVQSQFGRLHEVMFNMTQIVDSYMPHSPAKVGPLSKLDEWGPGMMGAFMDGIQASMPDLQRMMNQVATMSTLAQPSGGFGLSGAGTPTTTNHYGGNTIQFNMPPGTPQETMEYVMRELYRLGVAQR